MKFDRICVPIVSFPKSGNTWVRFILGNLFSKPEIRVDFNNINKIVPTALSEIDNRVIEMLSQDSPIFYKSHRFFRELKQDEVDRAIYIVRDGFDAVYSYWHFTNARTPGLFPNMRIFMRHYHRSWGHWGQHIASYTEDQKKTEQILVVKYENLLSDPVTEVVKILRFLEVERSVDKIREAIAASDRSKMRKMTGSKKFMSSQNQSFHFVRSGKSSEGHLNFDDKTKSIFLAIKENKNMMKKHNFLTPEEEMIFINRRFNILEYYEYVLYKKKYTSRQIIKKLLTN